MITHTVKMTIPNATAESFYNCMISPTDDWYKRWLPDEHFEFHIVKRGQENHLGDLIYYDETLGTAKHRLKFYAVVTVADRPNRVVFQMRKFGLNLPGFLELEFIDTDDGLALKHEVRIGWRGLGRVIDPILRLFFNRAFFEALEGHCDREWLCLAKILEVSKNV